MLIKEEAELQHVLAHILRAIQFNIEAAGYLADGLHEQAMPLIQAAQYECDSIEGLVTFEGDEDFVRHFTDKRMALGDKHGLPRQDETSPQETQESKEGEET
jgi:hypothetical protein